jgi:S1-C subfamily serine protease
MLHIKRIVFVAFLVAVFVVALRYYAPMPGHVVTSDKRLIPMHSEPAGSFSDVFTVNVEGIPVGMTARGTSFPLGHGLWLTARHVVGDDCEHIVLIIDGTNVFATIKYLDSNADLAVLQTASVGVSALPIEEADPAEDESAYAFGFPKGMLGGTEDQLIGRARMKLGGRLMGTAPVLTWIEVQRYPDNLESLSGISGGPMLDDNGNVIGIMVAASVRRGRNYTVAPEILHKIEQELASEAPPSGTVPARDAVTQPVSLEHSANALSQNARIALTYCIPP